MTRPRILVIPKNGESYMMKNINEAAPFFGMDCLRLQYHIEEGEPISKGGKIYFVDYVAGDSGSTALVKQQHRKRSIYTIVSGDERIEFSSFNKMTVYFHHGFKWFNGKDRDGATIKDDDGRQWKLEVRENDRA